MEQNQLLKVCEVQITYRPSFNSADRPQISNSKQCYNILMQHWNLGLINFLEEFKIILLNRTNKVLGLVDISIGGVSGTTGTHTKTKQTKSVIIKVSNPKCACHFEKMSGAEIIKFD
ncbi:hypothetical protein [Pedobacter sp. AJM]|uniref:hypothetical protein n=1 Tax=Pedobacter sp. AJM TaxID=2003629 RepID=UPI000B4B518D|nr:hypothetical protein [Pedobacter sp. AJM]OWK68835.1 hypothetical protein CBW18_20415 [Pedobacter sp. AJM]